MDNPFTYFPGIEGIPFRTRKGVAPDIKWADPSHRLPTLATDMHAKVFDMSNAEDCKQLEDVLTRCAKGRAYESSRKESFDQAAGTFKILLVWGELFYEDPQEARDGTREYE